MNHRVIHLTLATALGLTLASADAQDATTTPSAQITVMVGPAAQEQANRLAAARGGPAQGKRDSKLEVVALFDGKAMPTGVTVSREGRIFLCFPRWGDPVNHTVVELQGDRLLPFPDARTNSFYPDDVDRMDPRDHLVSVQSVVIDGRDRLWMVDAGSINFGPTIKNAPKLLGYDLATGKRVKDIRFPNDVAMKKTYLNDVRFDLDRGAEGTAYLTDSGAGGIVIVDLASGESWRHLDKHASVMPTPGLQTTTEGQPFLQRKPTREVMAPDIRADGIALSPDSKTLYYSPLMSRDVYAVPADLLADRNADPQQVAAAVKKVASKPSGNDGLICDAQGRIYSTDWEDNAIRRIDPNAGSAEVVAQDERLVWPDTFSMNGNYLYVTSNQLARQSGYHFGSDDRQPPYALFRIAVDGTAKEGATR